jgi:myo-inositol-1(or 4)-monophosphatase
MSVLDAALLRRLADAAARYAAEGGRMVLAGYPSHGVVEFKDGSLTNPVTALDRAVEEALRAAIAADFPEHAVLGEEEGAAGASDADIVWALDPIDGTTNVINRVPLFAVSVAALWRGRPVAGALYCSVGPRPEPVILHGYLGGGAWLDETPLRAVSPGLPMASRVVGFPAPLWSRLRPGDDLRYADVRSLGSIALELGLVATGALQASVFARPKIWDVAAGVLLVQEAGGAVLWQPRHARRWHGFEGFGDGQRMLTRLAELRTWTCPMIVGSPTIVTSVAARLPGPSVMGQMWDALCRRLRRVGRARR